MAQRRFLIASSLARLIRKDCGMAGRIVEGYFPARPDRDHFVSIEPGHAYLVLAPAREGAGDEERTEVPRSQAEALLAVCAGKVGFECTIVRLGAGKEALLQRFIAPGPLDLLSVEFDKGEDATGFVPPAWFGPEVTHNAAYRNGSLARDGVPAAAEFPLSSAMLDDLLTALDAQVGAGQARPERFALAEGVNASERNSDAGDEPGPMPPALGERAPIDGVLTGLEKALKGMVAPESMPGTGEAPGEHSRPRVEVRRWRRPA